MLDMLIGLAVIIILAAGWVSVLTSLSGLIYFSLEEPNRIFYKWQLTLCKWELRRKAPRTLDTLRRQYTYVQVWTDGKYITKTLLECDEGDINAETKFPKKTYLQRQEYHEAICEAAQSYLFWSKPLGLCPPCNVVWLSIVLTPLFLYVANQYVTMSVGLNIFLFFAILVHSHRVTSK